MGARSNWIRLYLNRQAGITAPPGAPVPGSGHKRYRKSKWRTETGEKGSARTTREREARRDQMRGNG